MLERENIIEEAIHNCMKELYAKAQPEADYDNLLEEYRTGKIGKDERIYERHYLSEEEMKYIVEKYKDAYRLKCEWNDNVEVVEQYLKDGGLKDSYVPEKIDEDGFKHPGYRSAEKVPPIETQILSYLQNNFVNLNGLEKQANDIANIVLTTVKECKDFYKFDREEQKFSFNVYLGASPTCNKETVKKWWKDNYNTDIEIVERNPLLLWDMDYYGDNFEEIMEEEYGENWKEFWDKKWEDEVKKREQENKEKIEELKKQYNNDNSDN